jgi:hypothetical protein
VNEVVRTARDRIGRHIGALHLNVWRNIGHPGGIQVSHEDRAPGLTCLASHAATLRPARRPPSTTSASFPRSLIFIVFAQVIGRAAGGWVYYLTRKWDLSRARGSAGGAGSLARR